MEEKTYFGYYSCNGIIWCQKWEGDTPVGACPSPIIQKHELNEREVELCLTALSILYPFKELPKLQ